MKHILGLIFLVSFTLLRPLTIQATASAGEVWHKQKFRLDLIPSKKKIILIAGNKSHDQGAHEYSRTALLVKDMLDQLAIAELSVEVYDHGWPPKPEILNDATLIVLMTDGHDGDLFPPASFAIKERVDFLQKQVDRGCGIALLHFSLFASDTLGTKLLEWVGGYFDWQGEDGSRQWHSSLKVIDTEVIVHEKIPITNGVKAFRLKDEFYYNIRFRPQDTRLLPVARIPEVGGKGPQGNLVCWGIERNDGGRGFCVTMGHYFSNWKNSDYRKLMLNGLAWAAGIKVPKDGLNSIYLSN